MSLSNSTALAFLTLVIGFILGLWSGSTARNNTPYVAAYQEAEPKITACEKDLPRSKKCRVFYSFETKSEE